ncbi:MAG: N-acetylmuramoyl-L-alanine amidase [Christensenellaceae bacterium]|jgi:N-acetylmuramoyl-L-alanine amidase|nr:N-acetylmuramoyl-L-alanine amidase [Christensenellaceae bacterium]
MILTGCRILNFYRRKHSFNFLLIKRRTAVFALALLLVTSALVTSTTLCLLSIPKKVYTVVIDAGHGGIDGGGIGIRSNTTEAEINLSIALKLKVYLEALGNINPILTRTNADGLYETDATNKKTSDLKARKAIITTASPDAVISIHCNQFPNRTRRGALTFYNSNSDMGINLAQSVQTFLNKLNQIHLETTYLAAGGDYYILNCTNYPSVLVECGFLSNVQDDKLLNDASYQTELAKAITLGVTSFFNST